MQALASPIGLGHFAGELSLLPSKNTDSRNMQLQSQSPGSLPFKHILVETKHPADSRSIRCR